MRSFENTQSGRTWPARHTSRFSEGLFTFDAVWLPTSCVAASPPDLYGRYANFAPVFFSRNTVRTGSSRLEPAPPLLHRGLGAFAAGINSFTFLCGSVVLSHSTNSSSAITDTGV